MKKILVLLTVIFFNFSVLADDIKREIEMADEGDPIYQNNVGYNFLYGLNGFPKDLDKAIKYLNMAAEQEQVNAMTTVGWFYFTGEFGASKDNEQAIYWNQKASDLGFTIDPKNKSEYKTVLDNIVNLPKLSNEKTKLAKIHAYTIFCRRPWIFNSFKVKFEKFENFNHFTQNLNLSEKNNFLHDSHDIIDWTDWITNENANPDYLNKYFNYLTL